MLVYVIADYGDVHDLAFAEVTQKIHHHMAGTPITLHNFAVPAFDTVATGFVLAQTAINSQLGVGHKFFVNTAPRKDDLAPRVKNAGEGFAYAKLHNGVEICTVNSGCSLSFLKECAVDIRAINCSAEGSQFRSRDIFAPAFAKIAKGDYSALGVDIRGSIPDVPQNAVCYTDGYGNMKCSVDPVVLEPMKGKDVTITVNGVSQRARCAEGIFGVADGEFCFSQGSSGWNLPNGMRIKFAEIVKRGGSAAQTFQFPQGGDQVTW